MQRSSPEWKALVKNSEFKTWQNFAAYPKDHIALQDHDHQAAFRTTRLVELQPAADSSSNWVHNWVQ